MANLVLSYIAPSGQTTMVSLIQRLSDGYFVGSGTNTFSDSLTFAQKQIYMPEVSGIPGLYKTSVNGTAYPDDEYNLYVYNSGTLIGLGLGNFWMKGGVECGPSGIANTVWDEPIDTHLTNRTAGSGLWETQKPAYFADIKLINDSTIVDNEWTGTFFRNSTVLISGQVTNPAISVYKTSDGTSLFTNQTLGWASQTLGALRYNTTTVVVSGEPYLAVVSGVIDNSTRVWSHLCGIDFL